MSTPRKSELKKTVDEKEILRLKELVGKQDQIIHDQANEIEERKMRSSLLVKEMASKDRLIQNRERDLHLEETVKSVMNKTLWHYEQIINKILEIK